MKPTRSRVSFIHAARAGSCQEGLSQLYRRVRHVRAPAARTGSDPRRLRTTRWFLGFCYGRIGAWRHYQGDGHRL